MFILWFLILYLYCQKVLSGQDEPPEQNKRQINMVTQMVEIIDDQNRVDCESLWLMIGCEPQLVIIASL